MLQVELDIFSGRPNPRWTLNPKEEKELVDRLMADPSLMIPVTAPVGGLGYRGYIVEAVKEKEGAAGKSKPLPSRFRLGGAFDKDAATSLWLLDTSDKADTEVDEYLREFTADSVRNPVSAPLDLGAPEAQEKGALMACASNFLTSSTNFTFWNGSAYITKNNCYNFAANYRSNTFAQPGKASGYALPYPPTCTNARTGIELDGWFNSCQPANNLTICLVIWPNTDFHFYRKCANGIWCHKPGRTAARNYDNSGNIITNPETCNRGGYTTFCGYWYADNNLTFVQ